ncbi:MAG TPA: hypothetical protein VML54_07000 [Candidatus Limnocylindrales bacterium]|nr:hypothetical protein [Candidatus Limnocylindrales bacterium]
MQKTTALTIPVLLLCGALLPAGNSHGQTPNSRAPAWNSIYLEVLGNGGLYSVNFERKVSDRIALRAGLASWSASSFFTDEERSLTVLPLLASYLQGSGNHRAEVGAGFLVGRQTIEAAFSNASESSTIVNLTGALGYRYQRPHGGLVFRAGFTPFYSLSPSDEDTAYPDKGFFPSVGVSFGYAF